MTIQNFSLFEKMIQVQDFMAIRFFFQLSVLLVALIFFRLTLLRIVLSVNYLIHLTKEIVEKKGITLHQIFFSINQLKKNFECKTKIKKQTLAFLSKMLKKSRKPKNWFWEKIKAFGKISKVFLTPACWGLTYNFFKPSIVGISKLMFGIDYPYPNQFLTLGAHAPNYPFGMYARVWDRREWVAEYVLTALRNRRPCKEFDFTDGFYEFMLEAKYTSVSSPHLPCDGVYAFLPYSQTEPLRALGYTYGEIQTWCDIIPVILHHQGTCFVLNSVVSLGYIAIGLWLRSL